MMDLKYLNPSQVHHFQEYGVLIIENVLSIEEIEHTRKNFHHCLMKYGFNTNNPNETAINLQKISSTNGAGGILDIFYEDFKLKLNEHEKIVDIIQDLWANTYAVNHPFFENPIDESFDPRKGYMYIDRLCYRLPEAISDRSNSKKKSIQRSLTPHLDCCPTDMKSLNSNKEFPKWKPIQCFVSLTDSLNPNEGGFECVLGHHKNFAEWTSNRKPNANGDPPPCIGDFTPIRPIEDKELISKFQHIPVSAGSLVCWDVRIPHSNAKQNNSVLAREVIYIGLLPAIERNRKYALQQLRNFEKGIVPSDQWHDHKSLQLCKYEFSVLGRKLMCISDW